MSRHYCTACGRKLSSAALRKIYYPLLKKSAWHCIKCLSTVADFSQPKNMISKPYLLELFSGSKTISNIAASEFGYRTETIDIVRKYNPSICANLLTMPLHQIPDRSKITLVWASLPCTAFSILNIGFHWHKQQYAYRRYMYLPKTSTAHQALLLLNRLIWLIHSIKPKYFIIENPRGALRHFPQVTSSMHRYSVSYHDYGFNYPKPTDLFTNIPGLRLKQLSKKDPPLYAGSVNKLNTPLSRSAVPPDLIRTILIQLK